MAIIHIADRCIGRGHPCFIIAEAGVNHNGNVDLAYQLVDVAAAAGADAVKFQTFQAERLASPQAEKATYQKTTTDSGENQLEMLRRLQLSHDDYSSLRRHCDQRGIMFLSTPFEEESADFLDFIGLHAFKLPSGELTNLPFLRHVAAKGKPVIMSTGMASLGEVERAVEVLNCVPLALLHCTSAYPADVSQCNLNAMGTLSAAFGVPVGFSDHTSGIAVAIAAAALGACIIEKHFTLDCSLPGPDHRASLEPGALSMMIAGIRDAEAALGDGVKRPQPIELNTAAVARKSVVSLHDLSAGTVLAPDMLAIMRPGTGLEPNNLPLVLGRTLAVAIAAGTPLQWEMIK
jgi:N-acetylneuraminate synthase/N,N'-diacetyllegionaminate synthase